MDALVLLIPLLPFLAACAIGVGGVFGALKGELGEQITADLAVWSVTLSFMMAAALLAGDLFGENQGHFSVGQWLASDTLDVHINFITSGFQVVLATLFALLLALLGNKATCLLRGEAGFQRFFFIYGLFVSAFLALLLFANMVGTFIGWVVTGWCAYGLVGHGYQRPLAIANASRLLLANRIGDAGFIIAISLSLAWLGDVNWPVLNSMVSQLSVGQQTGMGLCFALAAAVKSGQLPFSTWPVRALEGPVPADAMVYAVVMGHAGVFLLCLLQPVFSQSLFTSAVLGLLGLATAVYSQWVRLSQTDVKSALVYASSGQIGLMFVACSLGFWSWALWHLCAHAIVRCLQFCSLPEWAGRTPASNAKAIPRGLFMASLQRFWLEQLTEWTLLRPVRSLAHDLSYFDTHVLDRLLGMPSLSLEHWRPLPYREGHLGNGFAKGAGVLGKMAIWTAALFHWLENRLLMRGLSRWGCRYGREFGMVANKLEFVILRPRYLVLFICITFLMAF